MKNSFNPREVNLLSEVVQEACRRLPCVDDQARQNVAARVIDSAAQGECDFDRLLSIALNRRVTAHAA